MHNQNSLMIIKSATIYFDHDILQNLEVHKWQDKMLGWNTEVNLSKDSEIINEVWHVTSE